MTAATEIRWRVQVRKSRAHKWVNKGLFETREMARETAAFKRDEAHYESGSGRAMPAYGFGNTRVVRYEKAAKK